MDSKSSPLKKQPVYKFPTKEEMMKIRIEGLKRHWGVLEKEESSTAHPSSTTHQEDSKKDTHQEDSKKDTADGLTKKNA